MGLPNLPRHFVQGKLAGLVQIYIVCDGDKTPAAVPRERNDDQQDKQSNSGGDHHLQQREASVGGEIAGRRVPGQGCWSWLRSPAPFALHSPQSCCGGWAALSLGRSRQPRPGVFAALPGVRGSIVPGPCRVHSLIQSKFVGVPSDRLGPHEALTPFGCSASKHNFAARIWRHNWSFAGCG